MGYPKNDFNNWTEAYNHIKKIFCGRCEFNCTEYRKMFCIEQILYIVEHWEISNDFHRGIKSNDY
jgi:hypothetical protein